MKQGLDSLSLSAKIALIIGTIALLPATGAVLGVANTLAKPAEPTPASNANVLSATIAPSQQPLATKTPTATPSASPAPTALKTPIPTISRPTPTAIPTLVATPALSNNNYYSNSDGNQVHSPACSENNSAPAGATAICGDGTYSFSLHRSGTCSHHGGVAQWL